MEASAGEEAHLCEHFKELEQIPARLENGKWTVLDTIPGFDALTVNDNSPVAGEDAGVIGVGPAAAAAAAAFAPQQFQATVVNEHTRKGTTTVNFQSVSAMPAYANKSHEELRLEAHPWGIPSANNNNSGGEKAGDATHPPENITTADNKSSGAVNAQGDDGGAGVNVSTPAAKVTTERPGLLSSAARKMFGLFSTTLNED